MIRVREVLSLEPFREFTLQAGEAGLDREITNVTMLDYETDARDYSDFRAGDFILSSLYFAKNDESLILEAFRALAVKGISGFAVKTVYYFTLPEALRRMADAAGIPIFTFQTTYMEDIIIAVNELMKERDLQNVHARLLDQLLASPKSEEEIAPLAHRLDSKLRPWCAAAFALPREGQPPPPIPSRHAARWVSMEERGQRYSLFSYQGGALLLLSCNHPPEEVGAGMALRAKLHELRWGDDRCHIGLSQAVNTPRQLDLCVEQSLLAARMAFVRKQPVLTYSSLGALQYLLPLLHSRTALSAAGRQAALLQAYDAENSSALWETLCAYVNLSGDFNRIAKALFQHPNTVRYRIRKVCHLWGDPPDFDRQAFLCVHLVLLKDAMEPLPG